MFLWTMKELTVGYRMPHLLVPALSYVSPMRTSHQQAFSDVNVILGVNDCNYFRM